MSSLPYVTETSTTRQRVAGAIANASAKTGVDFGYLFNQANIESRLNPTAHARTSSASGLYQFTKQSWLATVKQHGAEHGLGWAAESITRGSDGRYTIAVADQRTAILDLRDQPEAASAMAAEFASDNEELLSQRLDRPIEPVDLYLAHFLGGAGAVRFLTAHATNPNASAAPIFPAAAAANRPIFYNSNGNPRSLNEIRASFAVRLDQNDYEGVPPQFASVTTATSRHAYASATNRVAAISLRTIDPMPVRLSLDFARRAYDQLSKLGSVSST
jgi:hypothetical protein